MPAREPSAPGSRRASVQLVLLMTRFDGSYNDGYADDVSFVLTPKSASPVRTITYDQITALSSSTPVIDSFLNVLSANGNRARAAIVATLIVAHGGVLAEGEAVAH